MSSNTVFTPGEVDYLAGQRLGRLATAQRDGTLQASPVSFGYNASLQTIDIGGHNMAASQKFRNIKHHRQVAFVVDDLASVQPWRPRCLEIRGWAEALTDPADSASRIAGPIIRIHPTRIISWGIDPPELARGKRDVQAG
jgi:pyridoxamine 5'-phosphate oxidase family protein